MCIRDSYSIISIVSNMEEIELIAKKYEKFSPIMDERMRRLWAGVESSVLGFGGIQIVSKATGLSRNTIVRGEQELEEIEQMSICVRLRYELSEKYHFLCQFLMF